MNTEVSAIMIDGWQNESIWAWYIKDWLGTITVMTLKQFAADAKPWWTREVLINACETTDELFTVASAAVGETIAELQPPLVYEPLVAYYVAYLDLIRKPESTFALVRQYAYEILMWVPPERMKGLVDRLLDKLNK